MFSYLRYFFYLAINWNFRIAWYIIIQEIRGEKKYGLLTTGADELKSLEKKGIDTSHATIYMPASYTLLEELFAQLHLLHNKPDQPLRHFLDIGCGKGRACCVSVFHGFSKITGIDFSKELCTAAIRNCINTKKQWPALEYKIVNNDAFYFAIPDDVDCIFLFNPFDEVIMSAVIQNIKQRIQNNDRPIYILYVNPLHKEQFENAGFTEIYHCQKMKYLEAVILTNK